MNQLRLVLLAAVAPLVLIQGCDSTSNEPLPNSGISLCTNLYETCIDQIFHNPTRTGSSCSQGGCHNPPIGQDGFFLFPGAGIPSPEMTSNFMQVEARTLNNNLLLSKATGNSHGGGAQLVVGDLCYNTIVEWAAIPAPADGSACTAVIPNCALLNAGTIAISCGP